MVKGTDLIIKDCSGQMHVLEVVIAVAMIFAALFFISTMEVSSYTTIEKENKLQTLGESILENLESRSSTNEGYDNFLNYCLTSLYGSSTLYRELTLNLPEGTLFRVNQINMSKLFHNSSVSVEDCTELVTGSAIWIDEETRVSRIVVIDDYIYEIVLSMWLNAGG